LPKDEVYYDDKTLDKVREVLENYLEFKSDADDIINDLHNVGILFRERVKEEVDGN